MIANGDMDYDYNASMNTYMFSNIAPQYPNFNRSKLLAFCFVLLSVETFVESWKF